MNSLVTVAQLVIPARPDGRHGRNRATSPGQLAATDDRMAWLARYADLQGEVVDAARQIGLRQLPDINRPDHDGARALEQHALAAARADCKRLFQSSAI